MAQPDPGNRAYQKKRLEKIVHRIRDNSVDRSGYSMADFVEDVKCRCAREGVVFDNDLLNDFVDMKIDKIEGIDRCVAPNALIIVAEAANDD
jgi:hypothetical protein